LNVVNWKLIIAKMTPDELKTRCKQFSLRVMRLVRSLPEDRVSRTIANQLVRSGTSVAANYRAACLAKSPADFASIKTVRQNNR
jgi:four helix bundle protein